MKNLKKILACVMAVATLGSVACIPVNAITTNDISVNTNASDYDINPVDYVNSIFEKGINEYLQSTGIVDKSKCSATVDKEDDFSSKYNFFYYQNLDEDYSIATFDANVSTIIYFKSPNTGISLNDILSNEQLDELESLECTVFFYVDPFGVDSIVDGIHEYEVVIYFPDSIPYNATIEYTYNLGKTLMDTGVLKNPYLRAHARYDDYNAMWIEPSTEYIIVTEDGMELTKDMLGEYANSIDSLEKITCEDGTTINGATEYYTFTLSEDTDCSYDEVSVGLRNNDNINFAGCLNPIYCQTEMAQFGKQTSFEIPILSNTDNTSVTIGDSDTTNNVITPITEFTVGESTYPRGDINLDGKTTTIDLLMLKKYLLGLMEW